MKRSQTFEIATRINKELDKALDVDRVMLTHSRRLKLLFQGYKENGFKIQADELLEVTKLVAEDSIVLGEMHMNLCNLMLEVLEEMRKDTQ
jgi:hypothetical protein